MAINIELLRDVAEILLNGEGPDLAAGMDDRYGEWLLTLADDIESGKREI